METQTTCVFGTLHLDSCSSLQEGAAAVAFPISCIRDALCIAMPAKMLRIIAPDADPRKAAQASGLCWGAAAAAAVNTALPPLLVDSACPMCPRDSVGPLI